MTDRTQSLSERLESLKYLKECEEKTTNNPKYIEDLTLTISTIENQIQYLKGSKGYEIL